MRARFSRSVGLPVIEEDTGELIGTISGMLLHPDTGVVEGFFVHAQIPFSPVHPFLLCNDILHWGTRISIRHRDVLASVEDVIRLRELLEKPRPILGQIMVTEGGTTLGRCRDVQFSTKDFRLEWLFPKKFFRWGIPVPASQIIEVKRDAIIIKETAIPDTEEKEEVGLIPPMPEAA